MSEAKQASSGYPALLGDAGFQSFLWTQFLGAFNDNVYKMIVSVAAGFLSVIAFSEAVSLSARILITIAMLLLLSMTLFGRRGV